MASHTTTVLTDDLTGETDARRRKFGINGVEYSIDLTDENYQKLLDLLAPYRAAGSLQPKGRRKNESPTLDARQKAQFRAWAEREGKPLKGRGRYPTQLVEEFLEQQSITDVVQTLALL